MGRSRPSLGARGGEPRESNPPRGILPYVPFPGDPSPLRVCFPVSIWKLEKGEFRK